MAKKKTNVDLILALPNAMTQAVLGAMTPAQKGEISATQAGEILRITTDAAARIAAIIEADDDDPATPATGGDPRDD